MGFLDELDEIDAQKQKTMPVPIAPQGEPSFLEQLDQIDKERTAALTVNNRSWLQQAEDAVNGFFEPVKDIYHGALTLPATVAGQALDVARLATGDKFDILKDASNGLENLTNKFEENTLSPEALRQKENLAKFFADGHYTDLPRVLAENPRGVTNDLVKTFGSMFIPGVAGAKAASLAKALKFANPNKVIAPTVTATNAAMNAADTFTATDDLNLEDRYKGAGVAGGVSLLANALTGGAADKTLAKLIAGDVSKQVNKSILGAAIKGGAKDAGKEGFQEFLEEGGNAVGENVARKEDFDLNNILKRAGYGAALGGISGGPIGSLNGAAGASRENLVNKLQNTQKQFEQTAATNTADNSGEPVANLIKNLGQHTNLKQVQPEPKENVNSALSAPETAENSAPTAPAVNQAEPPTAPVDVLQAQTQQEQAAPKQENSPILQNRDRSSNSSVMQMKSMANNLDYGRTGYSRDLANGAPVVSYGSVPEAQLGRKDFAVDSKGSRIPVQYAVLEADDILTSNDINGMSNHEYGNPQRVNAIAGNGRITAMQYAYAHNTAGNYRQEFEADDLHGINPQIIKSMKHPVLVRVMPTENITEDIGDRSNTTSNLQLNPVEVAKNDVNRVDLSNLKFNADDSPSNESILQFLSSLPRQEVAQLVQSDGTPNSEAIRRFNNALFQKAYKSERLTNLFATAVKVEGKRLINILARLAPKAIELEGAGDLDIRPLIVEAVQALMVGIQKGQKLEDLARQTDAFEDPDVMEFKKLFAIDQRGVEKPLRILEEAVDFAINAAKEAQNDNMFGMEPPTRRDVLNHYNRILDDEYGNKAARYKTTDENAAGPSSAEENASGRERGGNQSADDGRGPSDNQGDGKPKEGADEGLKFSRAAKNDRLMTIHNTREGNLKKSLDSGSFSASDWSEKKAKTEESAKDADDKSEGIEDVDLVKKEKSVTVERVKAEISDSIGEGALKTLENSGKVTVIEDESSALRRLFDERNKSAKNGFKAVEGSVKEIPEGEDALRYRVRELIHKEFPAGEEVTVQVEGTNDLIKVGRKGFKHSAWGNHASVYTLVACLHVKDLIRTSVTDGILRDKQGTEYDISKPLPNRDDLAFKYFSEIKIDGKLYTVTITVKPDKNQIKHYYDLKAKAPSSLPPSQNENSVAARGKPEANDNIISENKASFKFSKDGSVQGIYDPQTGKSFIIAGNIKPGEGRGVFLHEIGVHMAADNEFRAVMGPILQRGLQIVKVGNANGDPIAREAYKRLTEAGEDPNNANEATAYLVQVAANKSDLSGPIKRFMNQLRAALVAWMVRHGMMNADSLTTQDLVDIAVSNVRAMAKKEIQGAKEAQYKTTDENAAGSSSITQNAPGRDGGGDQGENDARGSADNQGDGKPQEGADESLMFSRAAKNDRLHDERGDVLYSKRKPTQEEWAAQKKAEKEKEIKEEAERIGRSKHVSAEVKADISELIGKESLEVLEKSGRVKFVYDLEELPKDIRKTIKASSSEITSDKEDMTLVRKEVLAKVKQELEENGNQVTITSDKTNVTITSKGVKHSLHYRKQDWRDALALLHVKELVQESEFVDRAPNVHGVTDPYAVSHYKAKIEIDERLYPVRIVVRHHLDKSNNFYHISVDRENPEATRELWPQKEGLTTPYPSSGDGDSLSPRDLEIKYSKDGVVQGIYNLKTGEAYILTGNIKKGEARGIFLHEVGIHMAADREFREVMQPVLKRGLQLVKVGNANGDKTAQEAYKRLTEAGEDPNNANEATAYLVQVAANKSDLSGPIKRFMNQLRVALVAWMVRHGIKNADSLTTQDLVDIAVSNVRAMAKKRIQGAKEAQEMSLEAKLEFSKSGGPGGSHSRNTSWGFGPLVSDEFGHVKFGWGESLYDGGAKILKRTFDLIDAKAGNRFQLGTMSKDLRKLMRQFKADKEYIMHELEPIVRELSTWSAEEREMVSDIIEKCLKTNVIPPERVVRVAAAMQDIFNKQTDELLRLGGISKESAERWRGQYLPRIYNRSSKEFQRTIFDEFFGKNKPISSLTANHLKGRGIFETATTKTELEQYLAAGWELRDSNWNYEGGKLEYVGSDPRSNTLFGNDKDALISEGLTVWRDFTYDERILMGEVRDSLSRFVLGYMSTQRDLAVMRLYNQLAQDSRYSRSTPADGYVAVPNIDIPGVQGVKKYANLSGRYVTQEVFSQLQNVSKVQNDFARAYKKMLSAWKEGKTVLNPVAHFNNTVGNITMCHFAGVSYWDVNKYVEAAREFAKGEKKSTLIQEAFKYGLFSGSFTKEEMAALVPDKQLQELLNRSESGLDKAIDLVNGVLSWGLRSKLRSAYEFEDSFFKLVLYKKAREEALMSPEDAVDYATSYIFTYDDLPTGAAAIRDYAVPFFAWTYKAIPCLLKTALVYPHRFLAPAAVLYGLNMATYFLLAGGGGDDDDLLKRWERAQKLQDYESETMPDFMKGLTAFLTPKSVRIWNDSLTGQAQFLDISRWIPGGDMFDADNQMGGVSIFQPLMPSHPLVGLGLAMFANKDSFTGKEVVNDKADTEMEKLRKRGAWLAKNLSPALAPWSYHGTRLAQAISYETGYGFLRSAPFAKETHEELTSLFGVNGFTGNHVPMELSRALEHSVGVKNRLVDFEYQEAMAGLDTNREIKAIKEQHRAKVRDATKRKLPPSTLKLEQRDTDERIRRIREKEKERRENLAKAKQAAK